MTVGPPETENQVLSGTEIQVLYEIALSIEPEYDLETTVESALSTYLTKLNCSGAAVLERRTAPSGIVTHEPVASIPEHDRIVDLIESVRERLPDDDCPEAFPIVEPRGQERYVYVMCLEGFGVLVLRKDGEPLPERVVSALQRVNGKLANACNWWVIEELDRQNERLEQIVRAISHDLQNPLSVLNGRLELARAENDGEHLETAAEMVDRMDRLVDDLLTMARQGRTLNETRPVELETAFEQCWGVVNTPGSEATLVDDLTVVADPTRLQQLLENLLDNAVDHGGPAARVEIGSIGDEGFYVADDGPGIPPEKRDAVFESGHSTTAEGSGFGLAIVREIAEAHGWDLRVTESAEGGARIEITGVDTE
jgi:signal transduction histidine kinase